MKSLPKRAGSKSQYIFWIIVSLVTATYGAVTMVGGGAFWGVTWMIAGCGLAMRETHLRMKWKRSGRVSGN